MVLVRSRSSAADAAPAHRHPYASGRTGPLNWQPLVNALSTLLTRAGSNERLRIL